MASFDIRELYFAFLFLLAIQATASAHPNTISPLNESEPESAMDVYRPEVTKEIRDSAQELYESVTEAVAMMSEKMQANQPIQQKVLSQAAVEAAQLKRATNFLLLAGEPAGADYTYRLAPLEKALIASSNAFVKHPANQKSVDNARSLINKSKRSRPADTAKVQAMVDKGDFEKAEVAIYKLLDQLLFYTVLIPSAERFKYVHAPWGRLSGIIDDALKKKRSQEAADALEKKRDEVLAYAIQFIAEIGSAATSIGGTGTVTIGDQTLDGPSVCKHMASRWQSAHISYLQARAYEWGRLAVTGGTGNQLEVDFAQFTSDAVAGFVGLINADTGRINPDDVQKTYVRYLVALAPLASNANGEQFDSSIQGALDGLAAKSPTFAPSLSAYKASTTDLLRWRNRVAVERTQAQITKDTPIEQKLQQVFGLRDSYVGLYGSKPQEHEPLIYDAAPMILRPAPTQLINQSVSIGRIAGMPGGTRGIGRFYEGVYLIVSRPNKLEKNVDELRTELMVDTEPESWDEKLFPLSLAAAEALNSAKRGDYDAAGGKIMGVHLEGFITRFATLTTGAAGLVAIDDMPASGRNQRDYLKKAAVRCDLIPSWVQHKYFFVDYAEAK